LRSIKRTKDALKYFHRDKNNDCEDTKVLDTVADPFYWVDLDELLDVLEPLHESQIMSESSKGHLGYVRARWERIRAYLTEMKEVNDLLSAFDKRYKGQVSIVHDVVYYLMPRNAKARIEGVNGLTRYHGILPKSSL
jgi:hypothetical protein